MENKIAQLRKDKDLTQGELAALVGVSRSHISKIESGELTGSIKVLSLIAEKLGVKLDDIFLK